MPHKKKNELDKEKSIAMGIAKQLCYGPTVQDQIASAETIPEIYRIMKRARMAE